MSEQAPSWKSNRPVPVEHLVRGYMVKKAIENPRRFNIFHPSAWGSCLRKIAYEYYNDQKKFVNRKAFDIVPQMERIFDNGHYAHARWQKYLALSNVLRGYWKCTNPLCGEVYGKEDKLGTFSPIGKGGWKCKCGNSKNLAYEEVFVKSEEYNFAGNVDGIVDVRGTEFQQRGDLDVFVVDFKTIKDEMYSELLDPKREHVVQVNIYMWLLDLKAAVVVYENKDTQALKEMFVPRDDKLIEEIKTQALWLKDVLQAHKLPPRPSGFSRSKYPCRKCDFLDFCYR
jgi:CRISPR/Cas system-associated exonuclease Cas4 (RecB family)